MDNLINKKIYNKYSNSVGLNMQFFPLTDPGDVLRPLVMAQNVFFYFIQSF